jgi:hypothetical protein
MKTDWEGPLDAAVAEEGKDERSAFDNVYGVRKNFSRSHIAPLFRNVDSFGAAVLSYRGLLLLALRDSDW